jgi:hypothetical protein
MLAPGTVKHHDHWQTLGSFHPRKEDDAPYYSFIKLLQVLPV